MDLLAAEDFGNYLLQLIVTLTRENGTEHHKVVVCNEINRQITSPSKWISELKQQKWKAMPIEIRTDVKVKVNCFSMLNCMYRF